MRRYVESSCSDWRILSALHHLVQPTQLIKPYEKTMKSMARDEQRTWALTVFDQIKNEFPEPSRVLFEVHGGKDYVRDLVPLLKSAGYRIELPVPSFGIGRRMQWYDRNTPTSPRGNHPLRPRSKATMRGSIGNGDPCAEIHYLVLKMPPLGAVDNRVPSDGLYFFFEGGEMNGHDKGQRIVRVGNHPRRAGGLRARIRTHYSGSKNASVFRKFLGGALLRRSDPNHPCLRPGPGQGHWEKQDQKACDRCKPIEQMVSLLLRGKFRFRCVEIPDREERNRMEEGIIATLANCRQCSPSATWLGRFAYNERVRNSGLWNSDYVVGAIPLDSAELSRLGELVRNEENDP